MPSTSSRRYFVRHGVPVGEPPGQLPLQGGGGGRSASHRALLTGLPTGTATGAGYDDPRGRQHPAGGGPRSRPGPSGRLEVSGLRLHGVPDSTHQSPSQQLQTAPQEEEVHPPLPASAPQHPVSRGAGGLWGPAPPAVLPGAALQRLRALRDRVQLRGGDGLRDARAAAAGPAGPALQPGVAGEPHPR